MPPAGSSLPTRITRSLITAEPDILLLAEALSKFKVFDSLLIGNLGSISMALGSLTVMYPSGNWDTYPRPCYPTRNLAFRPKIEP